MKTIKELKAYLKKTAVEIREKKNQRKGSPYGRVAGLDSLRYEYRHYHVAYCLLRGRDISEIEPRHDEENNPRSDYYIKQIMAPVEKHFKELEDAE